MTAAERDAISKLNEKVEKLPDVIIARLDDRYLKKDDADNRMVTRRETRVVSLILSAAVTMLALYTGLKDYFNH